MPPKAPKVEPISQNYWDKFAPPVDQDLWKRYMNEDDSDSDDSDTEPEDTMAGPSVDSRGTKGDTQDVKPVSKNDMVSCLTFISNTATLVQPR